MATKIGIDQKKINNKVSKALDLMNSASKDEVQLAKETIKTKAVETADAMVERKDQAYNSILKGFDKTKKKISDEPMKSLAIVSLFSLIIGLFLGRRK